MDISLVIPAFNEEKWIGDTLETVIKNTSGTFKEIIVVDNASTDTTAEVAGRYPGVKVIHEDRKGTGFARDAGWRATSSAFVGFLDADTRMRAPWPRIVCELFNDPEVVCVTGPYWLYDLPLFVRWAFWFFWHFGLLGNFLTAPLVTGGNFAIRRDTLEKMNGFDTSIVFHGDDVDTGKRAARFGRVRLSFELTLVSSGRRYLKFGIVRMELKYLYNAILGFWTDNPEYSKGYEEVR